jgi:hypothetical protein
MTLKVHVNQSNSLISLRKPCRAIAVVFKAPVNKVVKTPEATYLLTKGVCEDAKRLAYRPTLKPYEGNWPVIALIIKRIKEVIND